ncbi:MAG: glycosyltransferase [Clostridiales bacterium]|nr:glycosyltransferase [Clostridiales bacterium]
MKVLQINAVYGNGSTGVITKDIGEMLKNNGDEPYFAYQTTNEKVDNGYKIGNKLDWKFHALYSRLFGKQAYASKGATRRFLKWVDKIKPDVVHLHNLHSNYINLNMLCKYLAKNDIKTVITMHDCWYFTGKCSHYSAVKCDKWQTSCGNCPQNKTEVKSLFFDNTAKVLKDRTDNLNKIKDLTLVGCSNWISNEARRSKLKNAKITTIYNGVDTSIFTPRESKIRSEYGIKNDEFVILGMADKWVQPANQEIVEKIVTAFGSTKIIIVGCKDYQKEYFSRFKSVISIGYVTDRKRLAEIYSTANVFVNLTHADTLPTVNMESICCGTSVITYNCCGSPELIDNDSGFVVDENDGEAIVESIKKIKNNLMQFSVEEKQNKFNKDNCYKKYLEVYKEDNL